MVGKRKANWEIIGHYGAWTGRKRPEDGKFLVPRLVGRSIDATRAGSRTKCEGNAFSSDENMRVGGLTWSINTLSVVTHILVVSYRSVGIGLQPMTDGLYGQRGF
jgi:hypothetical protein